MVLLLHLFSYRRLASKEGAIWFVGGDGLSRLDHGQVAVYRQRLDQAKAGVREIADGERLPEPYMTSLFQDSRGRIWVSSLTGIGYLENDRYISVAVPGGFVVGFTEDVAGNLWISYQDRGLIRLSPRNEIQQIPWDTFGRKDPAQALVDPVQGGLWPGFRNGGVVYFRDGRVRASYAASDGLAAGQVNQLRFDGSGALWVSTEGGLSRLKNGRVATLTGRNGLPCDEVHWTIEDDAQSVWMGMPCGLLRVTRSDLDGALASGKAGRTIQAAVFDISDGARMAARMGGINPHAGKSPDGKLWFITLDGPSVVDPRHLPYNQLPPPVHIETVKINGREVVPADGLSLSHNSNDLEIDYTALSFTNPDRVLFRYKLEGRDADWQDVGRRRQAYYGGLAPKSYRFRVMACNNDGTWNEAGDSLDFSIDPAYYQTTWFLALCAAAFLGALWALYQLRLHQIAQQFNARLDERVNERTRIARDLHDTLLQSFHGLIFRFQAADNLLPSRPGEAKQTLGSAIDDAAQAITEARDAVHELRSSTVVTNDLAAAIAALGEELAANHTTSAASEDSATFRVDVEGTPRELHPILRDEIYRIAGEALRNAFRHARARRIEVEIRYDEGELRVRIRDDGSGIDPSVLSNEGLAGHWGLRGMRERAQRIGGKVDLWSEPGAGTEVEVRIPASVAYQTYAGRGILLFRKTRLFRKKTGRSS